MKSLQIILFLSTLILGACKKTENNTTHKDVVICYTFDEGFTGRVRHTLLSTSLKNMEQHELHKTSQKVVLSKAEMKTIISVFEKNDFKSISTNTMPVADRGGVQLEMRYGNGSVRILKSDANDSFVKEADRPRFQNCREAIEKHIKKASNSFPAEEK
ncbi:MAG: hypothetical protein MUC49_15195 [Raineya sp.]|jgi:hypothetical protein|nr:hypothetical protein [Raineya sp.]